MKESRLIVNTSAEENSPQWLLGCNPGAIEAQESRGQQQLVESTQLPTDCTACLRLELTKDGVIFGEPTPGDEMFCEATLPEGWEVKATDHSMWSELVDNEGTKRASIFYKAAFYDRHAFMRSP